MSKVIPPRPGQKLNGIAPSIFALAFLLVGIPFASTYLIEAATFFGSDPVTNGYERQDILTGDYPYYESSGEGPDAKCQEGVPLQYYGVNCTASLSSFVGSNAPGIAYVMNYQGDWNQRLPGCANDNASSPVVNIYDCGDGGYKISQNMTNKLVDNRVFPFIEVNFTSQFSRICDVNRMGESMVDYTFTISHVKRDQSLYGTNLWNIAVIDDSEEFSGTYRFNSSYVVDSVANTCNNQIEAIHQMDFVELDKLSRLIDDYRQDTSESFGLWITIEIDNLRTDEGYSWSSQNYYNPFWGDNSSYVEMRLDFVNYEVDPINTFLRFGVFFMGAGLWAIAIASTPYWDPLVKKYNEVRNE